ncbi:hypothetical protein ACEUZ9_004108 [Paracoccus litorisediminis]|uniref:hypothetical protein n=1 Tax=Paracoccus litorisediminis TaxID=2006130 RepID=UPI003732F952
MTLKQLDLTLFGFMSACGYFIFGHLVATWIPGVREGGGLDFFLSLLFAGLSAYALDRHIRKHRWARDRLIWAGVLMIFIVPFLL